MTKRVRLTAREIDAILMIAGDADAPASCEGLGDEADQVLEAFESGMAKLRVMLDQKQRA